MADRELRDAIALLPEGQAAGSVEEMNRYNATRIVLDNVTVACLRISGTFHIGQATTFLEALHEMFAIKVTRRAPQEIGITKN